MPNYRKGYDPYEEDRLLNIFEQVTGVSRDQLLNAPEEAFDEFDPKSVADYQGPDYNGTGTTTSFGGAYDASPAPLTVIPTSSSNASRPRTVAAGYQQYLRQTGVDYANRKGKLTVMFRDGTLYNYYDVTPGEWQEFSGQLSKGKFLNWKPVPGFLVLKEHGPADLTTVSEDVRNTIYRVARFAQVEFKSKYKRPTSTAGTRKYVPKRVSKAGLSPRAKRSPGLGSNPSSGGKAPKK
jgi:hypothetical protein